MPVTFDWKGPQVSKAVLDKVAEGLTEVGLRVEAEAKKQLRKGHGVVTGTLRRSIHTATPGYNWEGDNMPPFDSTPEFGGKEAKPAESSGKLTIEVGSGLEYAMAVHQGHGSFEGYHYLTNAVDIVKPQVADIIAKHTKEVLS